MIYRKKNASRPKRRFDSIFGIYIERLLQRKLAQRNPLHQLKLQVLQRYFENCFLIVRRLQRRFPQRQSPVRNLTQLNRGTESKSPFLIYGY